jgi:drug/metabolite transporter (DMT)-like permease
VRAIELADVSLVAPLISLSPLFMLLTSWLMLSETPDNLGLAGIVLVVVGTYFLAGGQSNFALAPLVKLVEEPGTRWALTVAILWSITANIDKLTVQASSPLTYTFWFHLVFTVAFTPIFLMLKSEWTLIEGQSSEEDPGVTWLILILLSVGLFQAILTAAQMLAVIMTNVTYVIAIKRAGMLITVLGGGLFFDESHLSRRFVAALLVLVGLLGIMFR